MRFRIASQKGSRLTFRRLDVDFSHDEFLHYWQAVELVVVSAYFGTRA
jgi:hypothetical protein